VHIGTRRANPPRSQVLSHTSPGFLPIIPLRTQPHCKRFAESVSAISFNICSSSIHRYRHAASAPSPVHIGEESTRSRWSDSNHTSIKLSFDPSYRGPGVAPLQAFGKYVHILILHKHYQLQTPCPWICKQSTSPCERYSTSQFALQTPA
jgi:hypothetical protein